jgi:hypothetical protein
MTRTAIGPLVAANLVSGKPLNLLPGRRSGVGLTATGETMALRLDAGGLVGADGGGEGCFPAVVGLGAGAEAAA